MPPRLPPVQEAIPCPVRPQLCLRYNGSRGPAGLTYDSNLTRIFTHVGPIMSKLLRGLVAGYGAKKLGGGCFSTVLVFLLLWWLLGYCNGMQ